MESRPDETRPAEPRPGESRAAETRDSEGWSRAREHFLDLVELDAAERERALEALRREDAELAGWVERLLEQDLGPEEESGPERFGPYESVRVIAVGGMGEVHLARRSDGEFEREVAIKRLRGGAWSAPLVLRFQRERQLLARLDHEYIARLIDGGTTEEGQPYLVLEYVDGRHIDEYCREKGLGVRERVELFVKVAEAVSYAHTHGVIHRDLKPSNILIRDDGQPRLLDFGIARLQEEEAGATTLTGTGQRLFTPQFASPEQVRGEEVTPATDVFALGVVLYHLLTDQSPWPGDGSLFDLERSVLEADPVPPSRRLVGKPRRHVVGDLDTIVLHCLHKRPQRRFGSVAELREELERHLQGLPLQTRRTRVFERLLRHGRRNPWQMLAAGVFLVALVAGGSALRSERTATTRAAELMESLQVSLEHARNLRGQDRNGAAAEELEGILESLEGLPQEGAFRAAVVAELSGALLRIEEPRRALDLIDVGLAELPEDPATSRRARGMLLMHRIAALRLLGETDAARAAVDEGLAYVEQWLEPGHPLRLEAFEAVGSDVGRPLEERVEAVAIGVAEARSLNRPHDGALSSIVNFYGVLLLENGEYHRALEAFDEALEIDRWNFGEGHGDVALVRYCRAACLRALGRLDEARDELEAAVPVLEAKGHHGVAARAWELLEAVEADLGGY